MLRQVPAMLFYREMLLLPLIVFSAPMAGAVHCPQGSSPWTLYKDEKCLTLLEGFFTRQQGQAECESLSGSLAFVTDHEMQSFVTQHVFSTSGVEADVWIGAKRETEFSKTFQWDDGSRVIYQNWNPESPSNETNRDCVTLMSGFGKNPSVGKWKDTACSRPNYALCGALPIWSNDEVLKSILEIRRNPVPIGFIFTELPGEPGPQTLWPQLTWKDVSADYAGLFFRVLGGNSAQFGEKQDEGSPRLTNVYNYYGAYNHGEIAVVPGTKSNHISTGKGSGADPDKDGLTFLVSAAETRPVNKAVRIWTRIA